MHKYNYYPFDKNLESIDGDDLLRLKNISESWFIDYKSKSLKIADYAKHISAFANQYGGWLVFGIEEGDDKNRYAENFCGVCSNEVDKIFQDIRNSVTVHMQPAALYEEKVIHGPVDSIGLELNRSILIIGIPQSSNTPHIHSSGRIYRRTGDQSFPKAETDRHLLDELWKRSSEKHLKEEAFFGIIPHLPEQQKKSPWVFIYLKPSSFQEEPDFEIEFSEFVKVMESTNEPFTLKMDNIYTCNGGFIARHVFDNYHGSGTITFRWWWDGTARIDIPLNQYNFSTLLKSSNQYKTVEAFLSKILQSSLRDESLLDCNYLLKIIWCLIAKYLQLSDENNDKRDILSNFHLINLGYKIPYIDSQIYLDKIEEYSFPIILDDIISVPINPNESNMLVLKKNEIPDSGGLFPVFFSIPLIHRMFDSLGVSYDQETFLRISGLCPPESEGDEETIE